MSCGHWRQWRWDMGCQEAVWSCGKTDRKGRRRCREDRDLAWERSQATVCGSVAERVTRVNPGGPLA